MRYEGALLMVKDIEVSRRFYQDVLFSEVIFDLGEFIVFKGGFCLLTENYWCDFMKNPALNFQYGNHVSQLGFEDEDIEAFMAHLARFDDVQIADPLKEYPWGQRSLKLYDPDWHLIEVSEDMKVVAKRFLRSGMTVEETTKKVLYPRQFVEICQKTLVEERF